MIPTVETCCHVPAPEFCLVGVIGDDRPHCARCEMCKEMVEFERYDAAGQSQIRAMYADTVLAGPTIAPTRPLNLNPYGHRSCVIVDTW